MLLAGGYKPNFKKLWKGAVVLVTSCFIIYWINIFDNYMIAKTGNEVFWKSNFMFLNYPESLFGILANVLGLKGRWYLITLPVLLGIVWALFYAPWIIMAKIQSKKEVLNA